MRNLDECQAEVFRRSEKRIKERRQCRNHILMACIPLVLCITLFGALLLPGMEPTGSTGELLQENFSEQHAGGLGTEAVGGLFTDPVEVSGNGVSSYYTSAEDVQGIITLLNSIVSIPESDDGYGDRDLSEDDGSVVIDTATYGVQYVRTNGYVAGAKFPRVVIIRSQDELTAYYEANKDVFDLERHEEVYSDTTIGFLDACDKYGATYFEKGYLIFVLLEEGSGSVRHEVTASVINSSKEIAICVETISPEIGTADMAEWHIILEMKNEVLVENESAIKVYIDENLRWDGDVVELPKPEPAFKEPPKATLSTPEGEAILMPVGYNWTVENNDGTANTTIADQFSRPLPQNSLEQVFMNNQYAETIYAAVPGTDTYTPTRSEGYFLKLNWEDNPDSVTFTSWPEDIWVNADTPEETVYSQGDYAFYARTGGFIYEFVATWDDDGDGYHGTANYYVYVYDKYAAYAYSATPAD